MLHPSVVEALQSLSQWVGSSSERASVLHTLLLDELPEAPTPLDVRTAATLIARSLPDLSRSDEGTDVLARLLEGPGAPALLAWARSVVHRPDVRLAGLLSRALRHVTLRQFVNELARDRLILGPGIDALECVPLTGSARWLTEPENDQALARLELLLWDVGNQAIQLPALGAWLFNDHIALSSLVLRPARGNLRERSLSGRWLASTLIALPPHDPTIVSEVLQVLHTLLLHPVRLVWVHAARAIGRLTGSAPELSSSLFDWAENARPLLRLRSVAALASTPVAQLPGLRDQLERLTLAADTDPSRIAAALTATPFLVTEVPDLWHRLVEKSLLPDAPASLCRSLAQALELLRGRGFPGITPELWIQTLRTRARNIAECSADDAQHWADLLSETDGLEGVERDPLDLERALEHLARRAALGLSAELPDRAAHATEMLLPTFRTALAIANREKDPLRRGAALNAIESNAQALAASLWRPIARAHGVEPDPRAAQETWQGMYRELGSVWADTNTPLDEHLHRTALRALLSLLDASSGSRSSPVHRGLAARMVCTSLHDARWLHPAPTDLDRSQLGSALGALAWRLLDHVRGEAHAAPDDFHWFGPFAAWWTLESGRPALLRAVARSLPMLDPGIVEKCIRESEMLRAQFRVAEHPNTWLPEAKRAFAALRADRTELARALDEFAIALGALADAGSDARKRAAAILPLATTVERLRLGLEDPERALRPAQNITSENSLIQGLTQALTEAINTRNTSALDKHCEALGPTLGPLLLDTVQRTAAKAAPSIAPTAKQDDELVAGYERIRALGEGGMGSVYLVRRPPSERLFVMKLPRPEALQGVLDSEREAVIASFHEEAAAMAKLYHPNIANIIDYGVHNELPFLVIEYLLGTDLKQYASAGKLSIEELKPIVRNSCAGLHALHADGLVHRDVKPGNLWLRLGLREDAQFDPKEHRDPNHTPVLATVVIDFGMVRAFRLPAESAGRMVAGTPGYIAPEQVLDPIDLDGRADVYSLAGCVYFAYTGGRSFFDEHRDMRERVLAHLRQEPLADPRRAKELPAGLLALLRQATARAPAERPDPMAFARAFDAL